MLSHAAFVYVDACWNVQCSFCEGWPIEQGGKRPWRARRIGRQSQANENVRETSVVTVKIDGTEDTVAVGRKNELRRRVKKGVFQMLLMSTFSYGQ